jgi:tetratricopeptide (TPR) repeat protein
LIRVDQEAGQTRCALGESFDRATAALPDDVQGLVLSRIDRLPPEQQLTLKVASVIGRTFAFRPLSYTLQQHAEINDEVLGQHLDGLAALDLTPLDSPEPEPIYVFRHITTQEVAYETLLFAQRRDLHHTVAGWYEAAFASEAELAPYYPLLVHHTHHAEDLDRERHYAGLAGHRAAAQYANDDAVRYLSRALELTPEETLEQRYDLLLAREKVLDLQGEREAQEQDIEALKMLAEAMGNSGKQAEAVLRQAYLAEILGDYTSSIAAAQRAVSLAEAVSSAQRQASGHFQWGRSLWLQGEYATADTRLRHALGIAQAEHLPTVEADSLLNLGIVAYYQGDYAKATTCFGKAQDAYHLTGDRVGESKALTNLGAVASDQGSHRIAREHFESALRICSEAGDLRGEIMALNNLGICLSELGEYSSAATYCERCVRLGEEIGDRESTGNALNNLGLFSMHQGALQKARDLFSQALVIVREIGDRQNEASILSNIALLWHSSGNDVISHETGQLAAQISHELGDRSTEAEALTHIGHALSGLERLHEAAHAYRRGLAIRRELGEENMAMESLAGLARVAIAQGDVAQAQIWVEEILNHLTTGTLDGTYEPMRVYLTCYRVLEASGDARSEEVLATAHSLLQEQAAKIENKEMRRSFLENVPAHRELIEAWNG